MKIEINKDGELLIDTVMPSIAIRNKPDRDLLLLSIGCEDNGGFIILYADHKILLSNNIVTIEK